MWWANHAALRDIWNAETLDDLLARDFTDTTTATTIRMQGILSRIEGGDICREQWTLYPNGKATTVELVISLIRIDDGRSAFCAKRKVSPKILMNPEREELKCFVMFPLRFVNSVRRETQSTAMQKI